MKQLFKNLLENNIKTLNVSKTNSISKGPYLLTNNFK